MTGTSPGPPPGPPPPGPTSAAATSPDAESGARVGHAAQSAAGCRARARALLEELGIPADARLAEEFLAETLGLILDRPDHLDLKIAAAAITEMRDAFAMFAPYRDTPKVTIFGSARVKNHDPLWEQTRKVAASLADKGWMVDHGRGSGHHAGRDGGRRAREQHRRVDPAPVRAGRQPDHRRRREVREHEVLLHPQADAREGEPRLRLPSRAASARSTRRSSC